LQDLVHHSSDRLSNKINWLNIIRPDWFDTDSSELRSSVQVYLIMKNIIETRHNHFENNQLIELVMNNSELDSYRTVLIHSIMKNEQWKLIYSFAEYEHDWLFLSNHSARVNTHIFSN